MAKIIEGVVIPDDFQARVSFSVYDLFTPQTIKADVLLFRWILHNWSDSSCTRILRAQIPALRTGSRLVIQDTCMPRPGTVPLWKERDLRSYDMDMAATFNAREKEIAEWESLLRAADPRFQLNKVFQPEGSALGVIDIIWNNGV
ncbi:S-adenosyl-L-methionine-dependent methyltransferase [Camillea tinctor]|nr:S-adenosyl-L-methionine-dependent methyltransferase [Camillea tinctor]